jgi:penicillin amidase
VRRSLLISALLLVSCIAHAPERFAGPDTVVVTGALPEWPINIIEDAWGIPHIRARSKDDAAFALGYLHAEERLWQLEFSRRLGSGTLSEILGKRTLITDRFLRTVGFRRAAADSWTAIGDSERRILEAYASGINAAVDGLDELPPEFKLLRFKPAPWTPLDSLVIVKTMAWVLSSSAKDDALYWRVARDLGEEEARWFLPTYPADAPRILPGDQLKELRDRAPRAPDEGVETGEGHGRGRDHGLDAWLGTGDDVGSNAWVVHGSRTNTGAPILANDPHLSVQVPSIWYLAEVDSPDLHVIGPTLVGIPGFPMGHNEHIAWGVTNVGADVMDFYREQPDPQDPTRVRRAVGWETLTEITETIHVKGRRKPVELTVRFSSNGPLVTEFYAGDFDPAEEVALRWTALDPGDRTVTAFFKIMEARNFDEFRAALETYAVPSQNFVYADREGHIGWQIPGRIPIRDPSFDGQRPGRGWVAQDAWQGWIPYDELPRAYDPLQGWIVTANHKPIPDDYRHDLGRSFTAPQRAIRIIDLIEQGSGRDVAGNRAIQMDVTTPQAHDLVPVILKVTPASPLESYAQDLLRDWDGSHDLDSGAAAVFNAWGWETSNAVIGAVLDGALTGRVYGMNPLFIDQLFHGPAGKLCVTKTTADCDDLAAQSLTRAVKRLKKELGGNATKWRWGDLHHIRYHHPLAVIPSLKKSLDTELPSPGGPATVNVGPFPMRAPFTQTHHASYRQVIDLSDWSKSMWMASLGQSGVPWREHYRDMAEPWVEGTMLPMLFGREDVDRHAARTRQIRR